MRNIFLIFTLLAFAATANATNWYIDPEATGTGAGTSWTNAWTSFSGGAHPVVWGGAGIVAGDTLYISGGTVSQTYTSGFTVGASGTAGNPITIRVGQDAGHNGEAIFDFDALGDTATLYSGIEFYNRSYITINGLVGSTRSLTVKNLRNSSNKSYGRAIGDRSSSGATSSNIIVQYVNIDNCNSGIALANGTGYEVSYNVLTNMRGDVGISVAGTGEWDANLVHHNSIGLLWKRQVASEAYGGPDGISAKHGTSIYNNTFSTAEVAWYVSDQHQDFIQCTGNYVKVYNNDFVNIADSGFDFDAGYSNYTPHDIWIFNNTFRIVDALDVYPEYIRMYNCNQTVTNLKIFNNDFIDNHNYANIRIACGASTTGSGNEVKNNIWYNSSGTATTFSLAGAALGSSFAFDYNVYYGTTNTTYLGSTTSATNWIAAHEAHGVTTQPLFTSYTQYTLANDYNLTAEDTVAKDTGVSMASYSTADQLGIDRPQGIAWDRGPLEYQGSPLTNGACGTADGVPVAEAPSTNLCTSGVESEVTGSLADGFAWTCGGVGGGTSDFCSTPAFAYATTSSTASSRAKTAQSVMLSTSAGSYSVSSTAYCKSTTGACTPSTSYTGTLTDVNINAGTFYLCYRSTDASSNVEPTKCITMLTGYWK